jgi:2-oxo-3-hexenedioate decarboxylase
MTVDPACIATEVLAALDDARQIATLADRLDGFDIDRAYRVTTELRRLRVARGERPVGRKIGFTNHGIWDEYGVFQPIWGDVYDSTLQDVQAGASVRISHLPEPRIEPEIVLGIDRDLAPGMTIAEFEASIAWVAHGFEIVQSVFAGWKFTVADCIADGGLHGGLAVGPRRLLAPGERAGLAAALAGLKVSLSRNGEPVDSGLGANALDGPVHALKHLVEALAADPDSPPLRAGETVTTGTLTRAFPIAPGETWSTSVSAYPLPGLAVTFA